MEVAAANQTGLSFWPIRRLDQRFIQLAAVRKDVQTLVDAALNRNELIRHEILTWLKESRNVQDRLIEKRRSWMRNSTSLDDNIQAILNKRRTFGQIVSDEVGLPTRDETAKRIIEALKHDQISLVGIYGMAGVGKTVLLNSILVYQHFKRDPSFDKVVKVTLSKHPDLRRIQDYIANQLNLQLQEDPEESTFLEKFNQGGDEKVMILLDDLWDKMDLSQLGIPYKSCKIVFTTKSEHVCRLMEAQRIFRIDELSEQDSLRLFLSNVGDVMDRDHMFEDIVKQCMGVPMAIVILGRALRRVGYGDQGAFPYTRSGRLKSTLRGMNTNPVSKAIQVSYDLLPTQTAKICFLFCCMFPEDFRIPCSTLLSYVVGEKLFQDVDTLDEIQNSLNAIVEMLTYLGLLLKLNQDCVMMHDIVRDMAIQIGSFGSHQFIVYAGMGLTEWPTMRLGTCKRVSFMHNKLGNEEALPTQVIAQNLSTFSLHGNHYLKEIPGKFFHEMKGLLTLDLSETSIVSLPQSLSCLVKLRTLCLDRCFSLNNITPLEKLEKLEIFTLSQTRMQRLPDEMRKLVSLKLLDLSEAPNLVTIPPGVISSLSQLEELNMKDSFSQWAVEHSKDGRNAALIKITTLKHLTHLRLCHKFRVFIPRHVAALEKFETI